MSVVYVVTPEILSKLREPFGELIQGTSTQNVKKLKDLLNKEKPPMVISVGDTVSRNLAKHNIQTHLSITDNKSHRRRIQQQSFPDKGLVRVKNPQGTITHQAVNAIKEAMSNERSIHMLVEGEEDLLTLVAVTNAPENALVVYGQPHKGMVIVKVTHEKKMNAAKILEKMEPKG